MAQVFGLPGRFRPTDADFTGYSGPPTSGPGFDDSRTAGRPVFGINFNPEVDAAASPENIRTGQERTGYGYANAGDFFGGRRTRKHTQKYVEDNFANPLDPLRDLLSQANPQQAKGKAIGASYNPNDPYGQLINAGVPKGGLQGQSPQDFQAQRQGRFGAEDLMNRIGSLDREGLRRLSQAGSGVANSFQNAANNISAAYLNPDFTRSDSVDLYGGPSNNVRTLDRRNTTERGGGFGSTAGRELDALKQAYFDLQSGIGKAGGL